MYTLTFDTEACRDTREVGGKAAGLAEMTTAGFPVAPGFTVTAAGFRTYLERTGIGSSIDEIIAEIGDHSEQQACEQVQRRVAALFEQHGLPQEVAGDIRDAYARLCADTGIDDIPVAVRSSATAEDSGDASFAGEFETWVDIAGADEVVDHVHRCYASVYTARVLAYLAEKGIDLRTVEMAVVVQKTVRARCAGVMFTISPTSGDRSKIVLESTWGLGLAVVGGEVTPDRYLVDKVGGHIDERVLGDKAIEYRRGDVAVDVPADRREQLSLLDREVLALAALGKELEKWHGAPQDIEFAVDEQLVPGDNLLLLQCRPETVWSGVERAPAFDASAGLISWITRSIAGPAADDSAPNEAQFHSHQH